MLRPSTAEKLFDTTRTSSTDSVLGVRLVMPPRATPFVLVSSTVYELASSRWPLALMRGADSPAKESFRAAAADDGRRHALARHAWLQRDQVVQVAAAERHLLELQPIDAARHAALLGFDDRRVGRDCHALRHAGHFEREVQARGFADPDRDAVPLRR